ncbi:MAG: Bax inhibitor-1/YccA family protein [Proteobacteria bacterium]|nr:Bax inhibitor-1/YccA family protein [Pseudomonadota bacterium]
MLNFTNNKSFASSAASSTSYDLGLRSYMIKVYNFMAIALAISGVVAFLVSSSPALMSAIFGTPLSWVVMLAPLGFVFFFGYKISRISADKAKSYLWIFAGLMGLSMSTIFTVYTGTSIARVFFISSTTFGLTALYGYTTKKDLTAMGSFMIMGLIGLIIASLVNMFLQSSALHFATSILGIIIFIGLTAYDSQRIKQMYYHISSSSEEVSKMAVMGALSLYMDFINLFMTMLNFFGERK